MLDKSIELCSWSHGTLFTSLEKYRGFSFILLTVNLFRHPTLLSTDYSGQAKKEQIHQQRMFLSQI